MTKTIMLVCNAGMSTSLLVTKMQKAAEDQGIETEIFAVSSAEAEEKMESKPIDIVMLGPQVRFLEKDYRSRLEPKGVPVVAINMTDYGLMKGDRVLAQAIKLIDKEWIGMSDEELNSIMMLIVNAGNAKSSAAEAIQAAKEGDFSFADQKLKEANAAIVLAHHSQTEMLTQEAQGKSSNITLLTVHSQDHLMTAINFIDLAKEIIDIRQTISLEK